MTEESGINDGVRNILHQRVLVNDLEQKLKDMSIFLQKQDLDKDQEIDYDDITFTPIHSIIIDNNNKPNPKKFILCKHNRHYDNNSNNNNKKNNDENYDVNDDNDYYYRSPWTNQYYPYNHNNTNNNSKYDDEVEWMKPSLQLRKLEIQANQVFERYTHLYYGKHTTNSNNNDIVSSVYFWDDKITPTTSITTTATTTTTSNNNDNKYKQGFSGCFLIQNVINEPNIQKGYWNSIHNVTFGPIINGKSNYTLSSTIFVHSDIFVTTIRSTSSNNINDDDDTKTNINNNNNNKNVITISGSLSKKNVKQTHVVNNITDHIGNIGKMIEDIENQLRKNLDILYIQKTKEVLDSIRLSSLSSSNTTERRRTSSSSTSQRSRSGMGMGGMIGMGMHGLPAAAQSEMNAALMARFKKSNP